VRRAIRILPVYWIAITLVWASRNGRLPGDWRDLLEHLTFTQVFDAKRIFYTIGPAWSLAVEIMFYAFLLVAGIGLHRLCGTAQRRGVRVAYWLLIPVALTAIGCWWIWREQYVHHVAFTYWPAWFGPLAKAPVFAVGVALAVLVHARPQGVALQSPGARLALRLVGFAVIGWAWAIRGTTGLGPYEQWVHPLKPK
jgi:peptidoglycan/LPS O-acetylase OafA/YrhL